MDSSRARLLFVTTSSGLGGAEKVLSLLARAEHARWEKVAVCSLKPQGQIARDLERDGVPAYTCGLSERQGLAGALSTLHAARRLLRVVRELRPTLVHALMFRAGLASRLPALVGAAPRLLVSVRRLERRGFFSHLADRLSARAVDRFTAVSEAARRQIARRSGIPLERIERIPNGVEVAGPDGAGAAAGPWRQDRRARGRDFLQRLTGSPLPDVLIGSIGRLEPVKGHRILLEAAARLPPPPPASHPLPGAAGDRPAFERLGIVLVGDGPERAALTALASRPPLRGRVWILGERADAASLLPAFDMFALPSFSEGMSNALLEAMAEGIPVIATRAGGTPEVVEPDASGLLVDPGDPAALAGALAGLMANPQRAAALGWAGRERVRREFSIERMLGAYRRVYDDLLAPL